MPGSNTKYMESGLPTDQYSLCSVMNCEIQYKDVKSIEWLDFIRVTFYSWLSLNKRRKLLSYLWNNRRTVNLFSRLVECSIIELNLHMKAFVGLSICLLNIWQFFNHTRVSLFMFFEAFNTILYSWTCRKPYNSMNISHFHFRIS